MSQVLKGRFDENEILMRKQNRNNYARLSSSSLIIIELRIIYIYIEM